MRRTRYGARMPGNEYSMNTYIQHVHHYNQDNQTNWRESTREEGLQFSRDKERQGSNRSGEGGQDPTMYMIPALSFYQDGEERKEGRR